MSTDNSETQYQPQNLTLRGAEHAERYRATDGAEGHIWNGATCLLLTTTGRTSGELRETPLIYAQDGADLVVIASKGGAPKAPNWYENLVVDPEVTVQILAERFPARAHEVEGEEYTRLWDLAAASWPNYNVYAQRTNRRIPVVVLRRTRAH